MKKIILLLIGIVNYARSATPILTSTTPSCGNKYCMTVKGFDFDSDASVQVRENTAFSKTTIFAGNDIYNRWFTANEDRMFFSNSEYKVARKKEQQWTLFSN